MSGVSIFVPPESMQGEPCDNPECEDGHPPVDAEGALVAENIPGGNMAIICKGCAIRLLGPKDPAASSSQAR